MLPFTSYLQEPWDDPKIDGRSHREITIKIIQTLMIFYGELYLTPWYHHNFSMFDGFSPFFIHFFDACPACPHRKHPLWPPAWGTSIGHGRLNRRLSKFEGSGWKSFELPKFGIWLPSKTNDYCVGRRWLLKLAGAKRFQRKLWNAASVFSGWMAEVLRKA